MLDLHRPPMIGPTKTSASARSLPMSGVVAQALAEQRDLAGPEALAWWTSTKGGLLRRGCVNDSVWKPALRKAGLPEHLGMHTLRHTYASLLIDAGHSPRAVMERMGHTTITQTMDTYGHLFTHHDAETTTAVDAFPLPSPAADEAVDSCAG